MLAFLLTACYQPIADPDEVGGSGNSGSTDGGGSGDGGGTDISLEVFLVDELPQTYPSLWDDHLLFYIDKQSSSGCVAYLLSLWEWDNIESANSEDKPGLNNSNHSVIMAGLYSEAGTTFGNLDTWRVPTKDEANLLKATYGGASRVIPLNNIIAEANARFGDTDYRPITLKDENDADARFLCDDGTYTYTMAAEKSSITKAGTQKKYYLRAVKTLRLKKK